MEAKRLETFLLTHHREELEASGISAPVYTGRGVRSITDRAELEALGFSRRQARVPALLLPSWNVRGHQVGFQIKRDTPRAGRNGRPMKYESPAGSTPVLDCHPSLIDKIKDPGVPLLITEGIKKEDAAVSRGLCCITLQGVWSWRGKNKWGGLTALADWEEIALNGRAVYIIFDSDVMQKPEVQAARKRLAAFLRARGALIHEVSLPEVVPGQKVGLDDFFVSGKTVDDLFELAAEATPASPIPTAEIPMYEATARGLVFNKHTRDAIVPTLLTNFDARITKQITEDDGREGAEQIQFEVTAQLGDRTRICRVSADEFAGMNWVTRSFGASAIVSAGIGLRDHARAGIQTLSNPESITIFTHTGWRKIGGKYAFLHAGGAIGADGNDASILVNLGSTNPDNKLKHYSLPDPPDSATLRDLLPRALGFLDVASHNQTWPVLAAVVAAPLSEIMKPGFVLWSQGSTGSMKTTTGALGLNFYGPAFKREEMPANFFFTPNAAERLAHAAKDVLVFFDDYNPKKDRRTQANQDATADRLIRGAGDDHGRERLTSRLSFVGAMPPRGLVAITAEVPPPGSQSSEARCLEVPWTRAKMNVERLTKAQREDAPHYARVMAAYIKWLAPRLPHLKKELEDEVVRLRSTIPANHGRLRETVAKLVTSVGVFLKFCVEEGGLSAEKAEALRAEAQSVLRACATGTDHRQGDREPSRIFLEALRTLLLQGRVYLEGHEPGSTPADAETWGWRGGVEARPNSELIGWVKGPDVYLLPDPAAIAAGRFAGEESGFSNRIPLGAALKQAGLLVGTDQDRSTKTVKRNRRSIRVWWLRAADIQKDPGEPAPSSDEPDDDPDGGVPPEGVPSGTTAFTNGAAQVVPGMPSTNEPATDMADGDSAAVEVARPVAVAAVATGLTEGEVGDRHVVVTSREGLEFLGKQLAVFDGPIVLDLETTGLDPRQSKIRLLTLNVGDSVTIVDCFRIDPSPLFPTLQDKTLIGHNLAFDLSFLMAHGFEPGPVNDTYLMSQLLSAGQRERKGFHKLESVLERHLGVHLDKTEQTSDWSQDQLSPAQLQYAAADVRFLPQLHERLHEELTAAKLLRVAEIEHRCLPAVVWTSNSGTPFDEAAWQDLYEENLAHADAVRAELDRAVHGLGADGINWNSRPQIMSFFERLGLNLPDIRLETLKQESHPAAQALAAFREANAAASKYGPNFAVVVGGRIHASWRQIGAASGRMSCSKPNLQAIPREGRYRNAFVPPEGRVLVKADYSQIELRLVARRTRDRRLLEAYARGEDVHTATAKWILGKDTATKEDRQLAKALNFGLIYGMGASRLRQYAATQYGVTLTEQQARLYRDAFFRTYEGIAAWHRQVGRTFRFGQIAATRTLAGRRRLANAKTTYTEVLNTPIQGAGADGLKQAMALLWERRGECPDAFPVLMVHDEIVIEAPDDHADEAKAWLTRAMHDGMAEFTDPVSVVVNTKIVTNERKEEE